MSTSRETARDALVTLLEAALVGTGLPVKTVTGSKPADLKGLSPLVCVLSAGSDRAPLTFTGDQSTFYLDVLVYVQQTDAGWTRAEAEDAMDSIEVLIAATYETNVRQSAIWDTLAYNDRTTVLDVSVDGVPFYVERIPTIVKLAKA